MIKLIGLNKDVDIDVRSRFNIPSTLLEENLLKLKEICEEVIILSTCNRTELYFTCDDKKDIIDDIFEKLNWNLDDKKYIFVAEEDNAIKHLMELCCGFHSKILGEDQILGQIRDAYFSSLKINAVKGILERLFNTAISCGKEFKTETMLYKIPVSSSSIAVKEAINQNKKNFMIIGFGEVGKLCFKTLIVNNHNYEKIYILGRNVEKLKSDELLNPLPNNIEIIDLKLLKDYIPLVDTIISCTSAPNSIICKDDLLLDKSLLIFDLAVPRDVAKDVYELDNVNIYNIDQLHIIDEKNKSLRKNVMDEHFYIVEKHIKEYTEWKKLRALSPHIVSMISKGNVISKNRFKTYTQKKYTKDNDKLVETLIKSTSNAYVNKAIEVLKEETLKGNGEKALSLISKIFCNLN